MTKCMNGYEYSRTVICMNEKGQIYSRNEYTGDTTTYRDTVLEIIDWENGWPPSQKEIEDTIRYWKNHMNL